MRCYFLREGRIEAVELLESGSDEDMIPKRAPCTKCTQACSPSTVSRSGVAAVSSIAGVHRTPTKAGMSRSGTDSPYRPTPNLRGCELTNGQQTASSHTRRTCLSNPCCDKKKAFPHV